MFNINDKLLSSLYPNRFLKNEFKKDLKEIINSSKFYSNKISDTDEEKT